jgi:xanthine/CO dehydrogenase XdhC/CoxF family maturation factor
MNELSEIFDALDRLKRRGQRAALATVVKVHGSVYRRPGARMLFSESGREAGFVSAACLHEDLSEKAREVIQSNTPRIVSYDTMSPDDVVLGLGLGCNGIVQILLEPVESKNDSEKLRVLKELTDAKEKAVFATVFRAENIPSVKPGEYLCIAPGGVIRTNINNQNIKNSLLRDAQNSLKSGTSSGKSYGLGDAVVEAFLELFHPPLPLIIFGANPDAIPLAKIAKELGWNVTVVDHRPAFAKRDNAPFSDSVILSPPEELDKNLQLQPDHVAVIMTHNFFTDLKLLKALLPSPISYVGLLGPKSKFDLLMQHLKEDSFHVTQEQLSKLYSPIGIDIGAETPEEIALSIVAEIKAVQEKRSGGFLKNHDGPIHSPRS